MDSVSDRRKEGVLTSLHKTIDAEVYNGWLA